MDGGSWRVVSGSSSPRIGRKSKLPAEAARPSPLRRPRLVSTICLPKICADLIVAPFVVAPHRVLLTQSQRCCPLDSCTMRRTGRGCRCPLSGSDRATRPFRRKGGSNAHVHRRSMQWSRTLTWWLFAH